jgi:hypothetical protein
MASLQDEVHYGGGRCGICAGKPRNRSAIAGSCQFKCASRDSANSGSRGAETGTVLQERTRLHRGRVALSVTSICETGLLAMWREGSSELSVNHHPGALPSPPSTS